MTAFEIAFNIVGASATVAGLVYMRHLLRTAGRGRITDPELVENFRKTAPYQTLDRIIEKNL